MQEKAPSVPKPKHPFWAGLFKTFGLEEEKQAFIENFSLMLGSGMPVAQALHGIKQGAKSKRFFKIIEQLETDIHSGQHFFQALGKTELFSDYVISLIRIGEESGRLNENFESLSRQQEKDRLLKERIHSAMIYPAIVFALTLVLGLGIAWFLLPRLASVFLSLRLKLPLITKLLISTGSFLEKWGYIVVPVALVLGAFLFCFIFVFPKTKFLGQKLLFILPGIKTLIKEVEISRFGHILGSLVESGVPMVEAMHLLSQASTFYIYRDFYAFLKISLEEGNSFEKSFAAFKNTGRLLPAAVQQIVITGEQSGKLEQTFVSLGRIYEGKSESTSKNLTVILEPLMLVVVWGGVAAVALAVIMPLYSLIGGLQGSLQNNSNPPAVKKVVTPKRPVPTAVKNDQIITTPIATSTATTTLPGVPDVKGVEIKPRLKLIEGINSLFVRGRPVFTSSAIGRMYPGETYEFNEKQGDWYLVTLPDGKTGWASADYLLLEY